MTSGTRRDQSVAAGAKPPPRVRKRKPAPRPPDVAAVLEGGHRDAHQRPAIEQLQRTAGNSATSSLLDAPSVQRDDSPGTATDTATSPRAQIDAALASPANRDLITSIGDFGPASADERFGFLRTLSATPLRDENERAAVWRLWTSFGMAQLPTVGPAHFDLWDACNQAGAHLPQEWLGAAQGQATTAVDEQVGASDYVARGFYRYVITPDSIFVDVPMSFTPDDGVAVPTDVWFNYIRSTWNTFAAVNTDHPDDKRNIEFRPTSGGGPNIQVSAGEGRANAGHFYTGDTRAEQTVPHEFGHLIGLADEYERDAADYTAVTTEAAPAGDATKAMPATLTAMLIHNGLFSEEHLLEWHTTAVARRKNLVEQALAAAGITADYQRGENPFTHEVAEEYRATYGHEMSADIAQQVDGDDNQAWREQVAGTFQYTNASIMGDMSDHAHPVQPRHVREFVAHVAEFRGGQWSAQPR